MPIKKNKIITTHEWIIINLIMLIPVVNVIMLFIWAFSDNTNLNKSNWAKASLIVWIVGFLFYFLMFLIFISFITSFFNNIFEVHI